MSEDGVLVQEEVRTGSRAASRQLGRTPSFACRQALWNQSRQAVPALKCHARLWRRAPPARAPEWPENPTKPPYAHDRLRPRFKVRRPPADQLRGPRQRVTRRGPRQLHPVVRCPHPHPSLTPEPSLQARLVDPSAPLLNTRDGHTPWGARRIQYQQGRQREEVSARSQASCPSPCLIGEGPLNGNDAGRKKYRTRQCRHKPNDRRDQREIDCEEDEGVPSAIVVAISPRPRSNEERNEQRSRQDVPESVHASWRRKQAGPVVGLPEIDHDKDDSGSG